MDKFNLREYLKNNPLLKEDTFVGRGEYITYWPEWAAGEVEVGNSDVIDAGGVDAEEGNIPDETLSVFKDYVKAVKALNADSKELRNDIAAAVSAHTYGGGDFEDYTFDVLTADQFDTIKDII